MVPENAGRNRTPRSPVGGDPPQSVGGRAAAQAFHLSCGLGKREIPVRPDIPPTQRHEQIDVCRPGPDTPNADQPLPRGLIVASLDPGEVEGPCQHFDGEATAVLRLLPRDPMTAKVCHRLTGHPFRCDPAKRLLQPGVGRAC